MFASYSTATVARLKVSLCACLSLCQSQYLPGKPVSLCAQAGAEFVGETVCSDLEFNTSSVHNQVSR